MDALIAILKLPLVQAMAAVCLIGGMTLELLAIRALKAAKPARGAKLPAPILARLSAGSLLFVLGAVALALVYA